MDIMQFKTDWGKKILSRLLARALTDKFGLTGAVYIQDLEIVSKEKNNFVDVNLTLNATISKEDIWKLLKM